MLDEHLVNVLNWYFINITIIAMTMVMNMKPTYLQLHRHIFTHTAFIVFCSIRRRIVAHTLKKNIISTFEEMLLLWPFNRLKSK